MNPYHSTTAVRFRRREMLAGMLGLPALLSGCGKGRETPLPAGRLVGPSDKLGHRLRQQERPAPADDGWRQTGGVIVGGGIAGLSAAWRLWKKGVRDFVLLELEPFPGGTSAGDRSEISGFPLAAHYLPLPMKENAELVSLLDEMDLLDGRDADGEPVAKEEFLCRDPQERIFYKGHWYEGLYLSAGASDEDRRQLAAFQAEMDRWAAWRDGRGRRAFAIPTSAGSDDPEVTALDSMSMAEWMDRRGWNSERLRWLANYSCRDDYGTNLDHTSAWAGVFYFASRIKRPGEKSEPLLTWPEGNGRFVDHFYRLVRPNVQLGLAVCEMIPTERDGRPGVDVVAMDRDGGARGFRADWAIFAAPQYLSRFIVRDYRENPPEHLSEFTYAPWLVANLTLRDRPAGEGFPLAWDNVLYESPSLGYVAATHQSCVDYGPTVLTYYYPFTEGNPRTLREELLSMDYEDCAEVILSDLARAHPEIGSLTERIDVMRWGHAMIRPKTGFLWSPARRAAARPFRNIHFANTDLSGLALLEESFDHGLRAADTVLAQFAGNA
jgi:hypothetical protein